MKSALLLKRVAEMQRNSSRVTCKTKQNIEIRIRIFGFDMKYVLKNLVFRW